MGCIQSKSKGKDLSIGNDGNGHVSRTRNDAVSPEEQATFHESTKHPHDYNDDPLVRGRADPMPDLYIDDHKDEPIETKNEAKTPKPEVTETVENQNTPTPTDITKEDISSKEIGNNNINKASKEDIPSNEIPKSDILKNEENKEKMNTEETKVTKEKKTVTKEDSTFNFPSVFIADENFDSTESISMEPTFSSNKPVVDVSDVALGGQAVSDIEIGNQVVNLNGEAKTNDVQIRPKPEQSVYEVAENSGSSEGDTESKSEKRTSANGSPSVRYQGREKVQYGLPEGILQPAPPKTKKADLIKPNAFVVVDKLVDQTPDKGFASVTKLASYLTGEAKKSDLISNEDEGESGKEKLPPLTPVKTKKADIVNDTNMFKKIDENARNTPETVRLTIDKLVDHLCSVATSDLEKIRAFYFWICHNISYVYEKDKGDTDKLRFDAVSTLRQGKGSYVNLMAAFCKQVNIPVVTIAGCSKGLRHQPDKEFAVDERNHTWNAVHINGEWRFLDCTWGSGFLDANGKFHHQFDEFWFLTDPEIFAYDHYPSHPSWQLLEDPIDIDEFNKKPSLTEKSRELGFKLISHRSPIVYVQNDVTIRFGTETYPLSNITADFRTTDGGEVNRHRCMSRIDEHTFEVRVVPPQTGQYSLILYGKAREYRHAKYRKLMEYTIRVESVFPEKVVFPNHIKAWGPEPNFAEFGFSESIQKQSIFKTDKNEMIINLAQTRKNMISPELKSGTDTVKMLEDHTLVTANEEGQVVHVRFPKSGYYRLDIYALGKTEKLEFCAAFLIECTVSDEPKIYPKYNSDSISKYVCELLEPMDRELPAESLVTFKLKSSGLRQAMIGQPMEEKYGSRLKGLGELNFNGGTFTAEIKTPKKGEPIYLSGSGAPPNVFWSRIYEFISV